MTNKASSSPAVAGAVIAAAAADEAAGDFVQAVVKTNTKSARFLQL